MIATSHCPARWLPVLVLVMVLVLGCGGYGEVGPAAYDYAIALYSITNRRAENKLEDVSHKIEASRANGELSDQEADWLGDIIRDARGGQWERANQASRRMMEDQVH